MSDFNNTELRRLDLTLLLVFLGLIRHRKASMVAADLGLTQSAISQALRRLRDIFGDPLFLRRPHGMEPTATALALEAPVARAVESLRGALGAARTFDPALAEGVLHIAALDAEQAGLVLPLCARLRHLAPGLRISVLPFSRGAALEALTEARAELALGFIREVREPVHAQRLYTETFLVAGCREALPDAPRITMAEYCAADHVLVAPGGDLRGIVDDMLEAQGCRRRVVLALPAFLPALAAVAATRSLVTLPARVAQAFASAFELVTAAPPLDVRSFPVSVFWHRRQDDDPRTNWLRGQLATCVTPQDGSALPSAGVPHSS